MRKRQRQRRAALMRRQPAYDFDAEVERINTLIRTARTSWFGLLSYLAFVGVTLLGVEDADFFIPERQTDLPLIGVSIPTLTFFWVAPTLGAALYAYFHLHLLKLYEALGTARANDTPLGNRTTPWLVTDFALYWREDQLPRRPMNWLALSTTGLLAFLAGPIVLGYFWFRSWPYHHEGLTILGCGLPLMLALYAGLRSLFHMVARLRGGNGAHPAVAWGSGIVGLALGCSVISIGWLTTEGSFEHYVRGDKLRFGVWQVGNLDVEHIERDDGTGEWVNPAHAHWLVFAGWDEWLYSADLEGVDFVNAPEDWQEHDTARAAFRVEWCRDQGVPPVACGSPDPYQQLSEQEADFLQNARLDWCRAQLPPTTADLTMRCTARFAEIDRDFTYAWRAEWAVQLARLAQRNYANYDLRRANLIGAQLQGADLRWAQLQLAELSAAQLQGADLWRSYLQSASLVDAGLQNAVLARAEAHGADLRRANLQGANLERAQLQGASLVRVRMQGALLDHAQLQAADLGGAQFQGVNFLVSQMSEETDMAALNLTGAAVRANTRLMHHQLRALSDQFILFSDTRPDDWPGHWVADPGHPARINIWREWAAEHHPDVTIAPDYRP